MMEVEGTAGEDDMDGDDEAILEVSNDSMDNDDDDDDEEDSDNKKKKKN